MNDLVLRDVVGSDIPIFFEHQLDPVANDMAAFTSKDPADRDAFQAHWDRLVNDGTILTKTILVSETVAGHVASFDRGGMREVTYWIGQEHWGRGLATEALRQFLQLETARPLFARAANDNAASLRVLKKCGFTLHGEDKGFSNARGKVIEENLFILKRPG